MPAPEPKGSNKATFCPVSLPGGHYEAGPSLFPGNVIKGINAKYSKYDQESWGQHVLSECEKEPACTSSLGFAAVNSGSTGGKFWFGYTFRGGPTTTANYTESAAASDATAYTIVKGKGGCNAGSYPS
ncbi:hypothetical protein BDY17DRAFT_256158 [Neohortaea acidophila]|uniref:Uncharacterized protein n=1 Tax=Neohortaea acidophila TaxID=245834 RepID=A0A6A6PK83_9PEZI|nr:uncharacterized protein BDY17DRAFT_256158 [Neohortaea acidophila]KAF2480206.1 hypothetical protein BDY17DRAFT_256158 [Neohortaea acidophila]